MLGRSPRHSSSSTSGPGWAKAAEHTGFFAVRIAVLALSLSAPLQADEVLTGILESTWGDPQPQSRAPAVQLLTLTEDDGEVTELFVSRELLVAHGGFYAWNRSRVRVSLREHEDPDLRDRLRPGTRQVAAMTLLEDRAPGGTPESLRVSGSHPWISILCKFSNVAAEPKNQAFFQGMYGNQPGGLDHYWRELSYNAINIVGSTAIDWVVLPGTHTFYVPTPGSNINAKLSQLFNDCTSAATPFVDFSNGGGGFSGINMMFNAELDCCAWGGTRFATLDGVSKVWRVTWEPPWAYAHSAIIAHEMGHGFGLPHATNWDDDDYPYDSPWDVMSRAAGAYAVMDPVYGLLGQHTNAHHKYQLDWISGGAYLEVNDGEQVTATIDAMSAPPSGHYRMARLPIPGSSSYYTVEVRKRSGNYDGDVPGDAVIIHHVVFGRPEPSWSVDTDLPPADFADNEGTMFRVGETFTDAARDISISVNSATANGFVVTIDRNGEESAMLFSSGFE